MFHTRAEYKSHAFEHFNMKNCLHCNKRIIQICDEWFELTIYSTICSQSNTNFHSFTVEKNSNTEENSGVRTESEIKIEVEPFCDIEINELAEENSNTASDLTDNNIENSLGYKDLATKAVQNTLPTNEINQTSKRFQCKFCGKLLSTLHRLDTHYERYHCSNNSQSCKNCNQSFPSVSLLESHMKLCTSEPTNRARNHPHEPEVKFICDICGWVEMKYDQLKEHINTMHVVRRESRQTGKRNKYIRSHPHRPKSNFSCDICQKFLSSYYSIQSHMRAKHSNKTKVRFTCPKCQKTYMKEDRLQKHMSISHRESLDGKIRKHELKHMCAICGRFFNHRPKMVAHEKTHFGIMSSCDTCGKQFVNQYNLQLHIKKVHKNLRPYSCTINGCEWKFAYPQSLKRHQARRHGMVTNRNPCPICRKEFPESTYHLKKHLQAHAKNTAKEYIPKPNPTI